MIVMQVRQKQVKSLISQTFLQDLLTKNSYTGAAVKDQPVMRIGVNMDAGCVAPIWRTEMKRKNSLNKFTNLRLGP